MPAMPAMPVVEAEVACAVIAVITEVAALASVVPIAADVGNGIDIDMPGISDMSDILNQGRSFGFWHRLGLNCLKAGRKF